MKKPVSAFLILNLSIHLCSYSQDKTYSSLQKEIKSIAFENKDLLKLTSENINFLETVMDKYEATHHKEENVSEGVTKATDEEIVHAPIGEYNEADTVVEEESEETEEDMRAFSLEVVKKTKESGINNVDELNDCEEAATLLDLDLELYRNRDKILNKLLADKNKLSAFIHRVIAKYHITGATQRDNIRVGIFNELDNS